MQPMKPTKLVPPHPGPLPWGEGEGWHRLARSVSCLCDGRLRKKPILEPGGSLSLRERAGVRGKGAFELTRTTMLKLRARPATIWSAVTCHRFCRFGDLSPKQGRGQRPGRVGRLPAFDGDKSPTESADESAHSKVIAASAAPGPFRPLHADGLVAARQAPPASS